MEQVKQQQHLAECVAQPYAKHLAGSMMWCRCSKITAVMNWYFSDGLQDCHLMQWLVM